jgi:hypothetical protein
VTRLLLVALFLEAGFVLVVVPWSTFWDHNYFAESVPVIHSIISNNFVRGAVSGLGVVNIAAGIAELFSLLMSRHTEPRPASSISPRHHRAEDMANRES